MSTIMKQTGNVRWAAKPNGDIVLQQAWKCILTGLTFQQW